MMPADKLKELAERLRQRPIGIIATGAVEYVTGADPLCTEAADAITELLADNEKLRAALRQAHLDIGMVACDGATSGIAGERIRAALKEP